jgi:hypothetical protein
MTFSGSDLQGYTGAKMMPVESTDMEQTLQTFRSVIDEAYGRLWAIPEDEASEKSSANKWSKKEILGHLIDSAGNNHQRFVRAQIDGRYAGPTYAQNSWVDVQGYQREDWKTLVELWKGYNSHLLHVMSCVPDEKLKTQCVIGQNEPVTLEFIMKDYVSHLEHHLKQIFG